MAAALETAGHQVWRHARQYRKEQGWLSGDLADGIDLPDGLDAIIHCAARSGQGGVSEEILARDNGLATERLVKSATEAGVGTFIYFSSLSIYGQIRDSLVTEETAICDPNPYGRTKYAGEKALSAVADKMASISFRLPGILGQGARRHWLAGIVEDLLSNRAVEIFNPDQPFNNAVHIEDLCDFTLGLLNQPLQGADCVVLGAREPLSVLQVVELLRDRLGSCSEISAQHLAEAPAFTLNSERAVTRYGYQPKPMSDLLNRYASDCLLEQASTIR